MAINVSVQYNGGLLPVVILSTQGYYTIIPSSGNPFKDLFFFCLCSLPMKQLNNFKHVM